MIAFALNVAWLISIVTLVCVVVRALGGHQVTCVGLSRVR